MKRIYLLAAAGRALASVAVCAGTALLLTACASDPGEKVVDAPFPKLADVPARPKASTTPEERAALRKQLEHRRDEIKHAAASLLRGGTEPVPVSLDSQLPRAPSGASTPPPPLPDGLPPLPKRPALLPAGGASKNAKAKSEKSASGPHEKPVIAAPGKAEMPPARAAAKKDADGEDEEGSSGDESDDGGSD